jgi:Zn-dependent protease
VDGNWLITGLTYLIPLVLSLTVHEFAHAWSAYRLGDDTAARMGRLTLNPLAHIDPIGTILLPLLRVPFGWAKPVPVNPTRFRRDVSMGTGMMITAAAGPASNIVLAVVCTVAFALLSRLAPGALEAGGGGPAALLMMLIRMNVALAVFNLLPIPPLDGSRIVDGFMPIRLRPQWEAVTRVAPFLLLGVIFFGRGLIVGPSNFFMGLLVRLFDAIA